jgi:serine/threonine protein kinase
MLTGKLPFNGENEMAVIHAIFNIEPPPPSSLNPAVPARLDAVVRRCLRKNADERYSSAAEVRFDLDADYW